MCTVVICLNVKWHREQNILKAEYWPGASLQQRGALAWESDVAALNIPGFGSAGWRPRMIWSLGKHLKLRKGSQKRTEHVVDCVKRVCEIELLRLDVWCDTGHLRDWVGESKLFICEYTIAPFCEKGLFISNVCGIQCSSSESATVLRSSPAVLWVSLASIK